MYSGTIEFYTHTHTSTQSYIIAWLQSPMFWFGSARIFPLLGERGWIARSLHREGKRWLSDSEIMVAVCDCQQVNFKSPKFQRLKCFLFAFSKKHEMGLPKNSGSSLLFIAHRGGCRRGENFCGNIDQKNPTISPFLNISDFPFLSIFSSFQGLGHF